VECEITYEQLAALAAGDLEADEAAKLGQHVEQCDRCRDRLAALANADQALASVHPVTPPAGALLAARRAFSDELRSRAPEIMTLEEVGEFLRVTGEQLGEIVEELPAFEIAGQIRIRRARLTEWLEQRERDYTRQSAASWAATAGVRSMPNLAI